MFVRSAIRAFPTLLILAIALGGLVGEWTPVAAREETEADEGLPLEPTRTIEFETDEATWLSLDVSPDGKTLVLELLGDLYTLPIEGGTATRITAGLAFDSQPRFSPDGESIAFVSDRDGSENLWIAHSDGTEPQKLSVDKQAQFASPVWTPDGKYVIVSRSTWGLGAYELWMYHVNGGSGVQVTKAKSGPKVPRDARINALGAVCSPDDRFLYYARRTGGFAYNARFPLWQVARKDRITGDEDVLTQAPGSAIRPLLSPDGRRLVYGTRFDAQTGLRIRDLETGADDWLLYPIQRDDQESRFTRDLLPGYAFTPDGREIILTRDGKIQRLALETGQTRVIPFTASVSQKLGPLLHVEQRVEDGPVKLRLIQGPVQSPDGSRLAFSALTQLYAMDLPSGTPQRVTQGSEREFLPAWSPDGRWLAYVTWSAEGGHIWKVRADGSGSPQRLTGTAAFYSDPAWSPDGSRIVALRGNARARLVRPFDFGAVAGMDVIWMPSQGGKTHLVIPARGLGRPHFRTDEPDRIYLYLSAGFGSEAPNGLVSLRFDGTDRREHLQVKGPGLYFSEEPVPANEIRISPTGGWALAHVRNQLYVVAVPRIGGEAPAIDVGSPAVPLEKLTEIGADYFDWSADGETITWAIGSTFFRQPFDTIDFKPEDDDEDDEGDKKKKKKKNKAEDEEQKPEEPQPYETIEVTLEFPRDVPQGIVALRGGRIVTMRGEEVIENGVVVIENDRILAVGAAHEVEIPSGAETIDVSGTTIVPGFIDSHAHWFEIRRGVLDVQNWSFLANVAYGVTSGLDVQTATNDMFAYQDLVDTGEIIGPRVYSTGPGIFSDNDFKSVDEVKGVMTRYRDYYRTRNLKSYLVGNREQRQWVVQAAHELGMMPTTEGGLDLKLDLTHVLDGFSGNEHNYPIVPLYRDVVELVAQSKTGNSPTLLVTYGGPFAENYFYTSENVHDDPKLRRFVPHGVIDGKTLRMAWFHEQEWAHPVVAAQVAKLVRAGAVVGVGAHGQLQGLGYHWEMWAMASGGMTPHEVLRSATILGARQIGFATDLGSLEPGKMADLVVLGKNPLVDIRNTNTVRFVMKNGELFEGDTLDQVWPEKRTLPRPWWWDEGPDTGSLVAVP